ncbi:MAG: TonB-dependent receptor [bacterium]|nr:TonB-dependent receptor [bacterium]
MRRIVVLICVSAMIGATGPDLCAGELSGSSIKSPIELNDTVLVTANRFGAPKNSVVWPSRIVSLPKTAGSSQLSEALDGSSGLDIRSYNGYGSIATLSSWGAFNRHMLLLYNGRVVRDYSLGGFNLAEYSADELQRVEIVKGPQSAYYGSDAVGGVVNLIPNFTFGNKLSLSSRVGSNNLREYDLSFARNMGQLGLSGQAGFGSSDNARDNAGSERVLFRSRLDYFSTDNSHALSLAVRYFSDSLGVPGPQPDPLLVPSHGNLESTSLYDHQLNENYSADLQYSRQGFGGETRIDLFWEKRGVDYNSVWSDYFSGADVYGRSLTDKLSSGATVRHQITKESYHAAGGVDWLYGRINSTNLDQSFEFWSASQDQVDLWGSLGWDASYGAKFDLSSRVQMVSGRSVQPSYNIGVLLSGDAPVALRLAYGYAFRLPSLADQFSQSAFVNGNPDLNSETSKSFAATVSYERETSPISTEVSLFLQETDSLIQYSFDAAAFKYRPLNVERFKSRGVDLSVLLKINKFLRTRFETVYQKAEQSVSAGYGLIPAYYVPTLKGKLQFNYERKQLMVTTSLRYTSDRYLTMYDGKDKVLAKVYELDASVSYQFNDRLTLSLTGSDLTDRSRPDQFGFTSEDLDYPSVGRRINGTVVLNLL